jgi:DNA invertase Pin-like site-specific DNA recombinase
MNAAAYIRVSSKAQDLAMQRDAISRAATARRDRIETWYSEKESGKTLARPELHRLRDDARQGYIQRLYVYRLDRLARSGIRDTLALVQELRAAGVDLVTIGDGFDLNGPTAEIILAVMAWAAQMERLALNERLATARRHLEASGRRWGRPGKFTLQQLEKAQRLRRQGLSIRQIAMQLQVKRASVQRLVSQKPPAYLTPKHPQKTSSRPRRAQ